jgi:DHA1 family bicyclomycin/chloramphenicol resistance-like MFS transporter
VIWVGLFVALAGSVGIGVAAVAHLPLASMMIAILVMVAGIAFATPALTSTALENYPRSAGTASSLVGLARYAFGAGAAPLVGLAGEAAALPMGIVTLTALSLAILTFAMTPAPATRRPTAVTHHRDTNEAS